MRRELKRMVGYTIVSSTYLQEVKDGRSGSRLAVLGDGTVFEIQSLTLALPLSDALVFAKRMPSELLAKYPSLPERMQYSYKLLVDDEILDVTLRN